MKELLNAWKQCKRGTQKQIFTILTGEKTGKKVLLEDGEIRWQSEPEEFWSAHVKELTEQTTEGSQEIAGERIFVETLRRNPRMVICGGGHVGVAIARLAMIQGMHVTLLEDRPSFADCGRAAGVHEVICEPYEQGLSRIESDEDTYFVIVTRGHRYDQVCLEKASHMPHAYLGMMGSRRRVVIVKQEAIAHGACPEAIERLHAPIGLHIQAETPEEIAVSVMAEVILEKAGRKSGSGFSGEILSAIEEDDLEHGKKVLATIISRKGSAPRGVGTKMIICQSGKIVGTIGGGCMEAEVVQRAKTMIYQNEVFAKLLTVSLSNDEAEEEGMVCGGTLEIFLEKV